MTDPRRPAGFWVLAVFLALSIVLLLLGQATGVVAYDVAVGLGLQESVEQVGPHGVAVNRAFGLGDTIVYIPLMVVALVGLVRRRRWALPVAGAVLGISAYWAVTIGAMLVLLPGVPGYALDPGLEYGLVLGAYVVVGVWGLANLALRGEALVRPS